MSSSSDKQLEEFKKSLTKEGHLKEEDGQISYVANDFLEKLNAGENSYSSNSVDIPKINPDLLDKLDNDCQQLSLNVKSVMDALSSHLHKVVKKTIPPQSLALSVGNTQTCSGKINDVERTVNSSIHNMYSLIAHCEELDKSMKPVYQLAQKITNLKEVVSTLESHFNS